MEGALCIFKSTLAILGRYFVLYEGVSGKLFSTPTISLTKARGRCLWLVDSAVSAPLKQKVNLVAYIQQLFGKVVLSFSESLRGEGVDLTCSTLGFHLGFSPL